MEILLPKQRQVDWQELLSEITLIRPINPFEIVSLAFVQEVSRTIMENNNFHSYPELIAMAYWMRPAHLKEIRQSYESKRQNRIWLPRGTVLHFAPSNVDSIFIYSWFLSLLLGNKNIIRLTQNKSVQVQLLLDVLNTILDQKRFKTIQERTLIVSYGHNELITEKLSQFCQVRVIWGGDETVRQIRAIPLSPNATELVFADKFSMAAIKAEAVLDAFEEEIDKLAKNFYNDTFWFNQKACSSPRLIFWIGEKECINKAKNRFWLAFKKIIEQRKIDWEAQVGIARMVSGYSYAATGLADKLSTAGTEIPYLVHVSEVNKDLRQLHCGAGLFLETEKPALADIIELISPKDQTLAVYGFNKDELERFAWQLAGSGIDRIVPIGQALNFQVIWDGYDLLIYFIREITLS